MAIFPGQRQIASIRKCSERSKIEILFIAIGRSVIDLKNNRRWPRVRAYTRRIGIVAKPFTLSTIPARNQLPKFVPNVEPTSSVGFLGNEDDQFAVTSGIFASWVLLRRRERRCYHFHLAFPFGYRVRAFVRMATSNDHRKVTKRSSNAYVIRLKIP